MLFCEKAPPSQVMSIPVPQENDPSSKPRNRGRYLAVAGLLLMLGPVISFLFAFSVMGGAFADLGSGESVAADEIGDHVRQSMMVSIWGSGAAVFGSVLLAVAVLVKRIRESWVYRNGLILSVILCFSAGFLGVIFGISLVIILATRRSEFVLSKE